MSKYQGFYNGKPLTTGNIGSNTKPGDGGEITYTPIPDPYDVYKATRPSDWLQMPKPENNELYMLMHIPDGGIAAFSCICSCTGTYKINFGTVKNGVFIPKIQLSKSSDTRFETSFKSEDYEDLTSDGFKQVMIQITATKFSMFNLYSSPSSMKNGDFTNNIVDIRGKLPRLTSFSLSDNSNMSYTVAKRLRYFSLEGTNELDRYSQRFKGCTSLISVLEFDSSSAKNMSGMFESCSSLIAIPKLNTSLVTDMSRMFYGCSSLPAIPELDMSNVTTMSSMFELCSSLRYIPELNTEHVEDMNSAFASAFSLSIAPKMDYSSVVTLNNLFVNCYSLNKVADMNLAVASSMSNTFQNAIGLSYLTFDPEVEDWDGCDITLKSCWSRLNFLLLLESLPIIKTPKTITVYFYYTERDAFIPLTDEDKEIATRKNWTLNIIERT